MYKLGMAFAGWAVSPCKKKGGKAARLQPPFNLPRFRLTFTLFLYRQAGFGLFSYFRKCRLVKYGQVS
jgi:hypothetical protein